MLVRYLVIVVVFVCSDMKHLSIVLMEEKMNSIFELLLFQVKSRMMGDSISTYKNTLDCFIKTFKTEVS